MSIKGTVVCGVTLLSRCTATTIEPKNTHVIKETVLSTKMKQYKIKVSYGAGGLVLKLV